MAARSFRRPLLTAAVLLLARGRVIVRVVGDQDDVLLRIRPHFFFHPLKPGDLLPSQLGRSVVHIATSSLPASIGFRNGVHS